MEPERLSTGTIQPSRPPPPPPPPPLPRQPEVQGRRNLSFSWSISSASTSSFNSLADSFKKNDFTMDEAEQHQSSRMLSGSWSNRGSQTWGREYGDYDPNRIPSSIFSRPSNQADWSVASNDSLFSIQMGSNSFAMREFMLSNYEQLTYPSDQQSSPTSNNPFGLPVTEEEEEEEEHKAEYGRKSSCIWEDFEEIKEPTAAEAAITEPPEIVVTKKDESPSERILLESCSNVSDSRFSASSARMSEESGNSCNSFAFPVLTNEAATLNESQGSPESMRAGRPLYPSARRESDQKDNSGPETTKEWEAGGSEAPPPENNSSWFSCFACCTMTKCHCCGRANCSKTNTDPKLDT